MNKNSSYLSKVSSNQKVLVIGSILIDIITSIKELPLSGEDVYVTPIKSEVGGCAINVSDILRQYGVQHDLLSPVGNGPNGQIIKNHLETYQYKKLISDEEGDNGWTLCLVEENGERTFMTLSGIEEQWKKEWFKNVDLDDYHYVYTTGYSLEDNPSSTVLEELEQNFKTSNFNLIFDPSPRIKHYTENNIKRVLALNPILHCNEEEIKYISQENDPVAGALKMNAITNKPVIITLGGGGVLYVEEQNYKQLDVEHTRVVDTIGAGDSHTAGFIAGLIDGKSIEDCCKQGNFVARKVVQNKGPRVELEMQ